MDLPYAYYKPFDTIYAAVTARMKARAQQVNDVAERAWLDTLIRDFQRERMVWDTDRSIAPYRRQWRRLKLRVVRLVAAIFLHVSYDLPRVLGDNWPAVGSWRAGPSEPKAEWLYFELASIFRSILAGSARQLAVTGAFAPLLCLVPLGLLGNLGHWVLHLREGAWRHARTLSTLAPTERDATVTRMRDAMCLALSDVSDLPWSFTLPGPPHVSVTSVAIAPILLELSDIQDWTLSTLIIIVFAFTYLSWAGLKAQKISSFVDEFGWRIERYLNLAVYHPEAFDAMKGGRQEGGLSVEA